MAENDKSNLKPFSLGIVVETKPPGTDYILVSPIETLNVQPEGNIREQKKDFSGDKPDLESTSFQSEHESKNYIRAKWMPHSESNRVTAPDVVASETVMLYKYADVDEYYWHDVLREPELRRLEDVMYAYSNLPSGIASFDETTSYWLRYNTRDKYIHLHTAKNDGEPFMYDVIINTKEGNILIKDDVGNFIKFDSSTDTLTANFNKDINLIAANDINLTAGNNITKTAGNSIYEKAANEILENAGVVIGEQAPMNRMNCNSYYGETDGEGYALFKGKLHTEIIGTEIRQIEGTKETEIIGTETRRIEGTRQTEIIGTENRKIEGTKQTEIIGESNEEIQGSKSEKVSGDFISDTGTMTNKTNSITNDTPLMHNTGDIKSDSHVKAALEPSEDIDLINKKYIETLKAELLALIDSKATELSLNLDNKATELRSETDGKISELQTQIDTVKDSIPPP